MVNTAMPATLKSFVVDGEDELRRINQKSKEVHWEERVNIGLKSFITRCLAIWLNPNKLILQGTENLKLQN